MRSLGTLLFPRLPSMALTTTGLASGRWQSTRQFSVPALEERSFHKDAILKERGAVGCALIGNPSIYGRVGFESDGLLTYENLEGRFVQRVVFTGQSPRGELRFAPAFEPGNC